MTGHVTPAMRAEADQAHSAYARSLDKMIAESRKDLDAGVDPVEAVASQLLAILIADILGDKYRIKLHGVLATAIVRLAQQPEVAS